jgi:proline racemase/trans-L-3-hydroxyproline dehydratase
MKSLEYHVGGQPVRVIVEGVPSPQGKTQAQKAVAFARHADRYRRGLVLAPRGHADMSGALLTEPSSAGAHAGLVFLDAVGYPRLSVAGVMAAARAASEHSLISTRAAGSDSERALVFDTPAGPVTARASAHETAPRSIAVDSVPSFVVAAGSGVALPGRMVPVDIAYGGEFYALVDSEAAGVVLEPNRLEELRRIGRGVCEAVNRTITVAHPLDPEVTAVAGVVFTGPARDEGAHLRTVLVSAGGAVDPSPGSSATPAVLAVLDAIGVFADVTEFVHEGLSGALGRARVLGRTTVGDHQALAVAVEGDVWATGEQTWFFDHDDPFHQGLRAADAPATAAKLRQDRGW